MKSVKNDNSYQWRKAIVRLMAIQATGKPAVTVLDCFAGEGKTWNLVKENTETPIRVIRIEKEQGKGAAALRGECEKYLSGMSLAGIDIIDLDAYGSPIKQLDLIFRREFCGIVCVTAIMSSMNRGGNRLIQESGIPLAIAKAIPKHLMPLGYIDMLLQFLARRGVKKVTGSFFSDGGRMSKCYFWFRYK